MPRTGRFALLPSAILALSVVFASAQQNPLVPHSMYEPPMAAAAPIATKVAEEHPELLREFEAKVKSDSAFATDPQARINWWSSRSNYQPSAVNRYPVLQVWEKNW